MVKLTEKLVLARARSRSLAAVKNLNCWASDLTDVSIIEQLGNVEVINASANSISSLQAFSHCRNLRELYLRRNNIQSLNQILHLKSLNQLRLLWVSDNPCSENIDSAKYRLTILKVLPNLQKLDNITVTPEEVQKASEEGESLSDPESKPEVAENSPIAVNSIKDNIQQDSNDISLKKTSRSLESGDRPQLNRTPSEHDDTVEPVLSLSHPRVSDDDESYSMSLTETNKLRKELGLKPMPVRPQRAVSPPRTQNSSHRRHRRIQMSSSIPRANNILTASLALVQELDEESLRTLHGVIQERLMHCTNGIISETQGVPNSNLTNGSSSSSGVSRDQNVMEMT